MFTGSSTAPLAWLRWRSSAIPGSLLGPDTGRFAASLTLRAAVRAMEGPSKSAGSTDLIHSLVWLSALSNQIDAELARLLLCSLCGTLRPLDYKEVKMLQGLLLKT